MEFSNIFTKVRWFLKITRFYLLQDDYIYIYYTYICVCTCLWICIYIYTYRDGCIEIYVCWWFHFDTCWTINNVDQMIFGFGTWYYNDRQIKQTCSQPRPAEVRVSSIKHSRAFEKQQRRGRVFQHSPHGELHLGMPGCWWLTWVDETWERVEKSSILQGIIYTGCWFEALWKILVNWDEYFQYMEK